MALPGDWPRIEAAARAAGWTHDGLRWQGPCPVTGEASCSAEPCDGAGDGVLMKCYRPECIAPDGALGPRRYFEHKAALLGSGGAVKVR